MFYRRITSHRSSRFVLICLVRFTSGDNVVFRIMMPSRALVWFCVIYDLKATWKAHFTTISSIILPSLFTTGTTMPVEDLLEALDRISRDFFNDETVAKPVPKWPDPSLPLAFLDGPEAFDDYLMLMLPTPLE